MKFSESIKPVSYVKAHASEIIRNLGDENGSPVVITQNGEAKAVLVGVHEYEQMQETFAMLKLLAMSQQDIKAGRVYPAEEVFQEARNRRNRP